MDDAALRDAETRAPYFAALWPAGEALARYVVRRGDLAGRRVLDLGCGVGAVGLAALVRSARVTFLDWEPRSLEIVARSARRLGVEPEALVAGDWRDPPPLDPFDLVLAADVLYEVAHVDPVARFLAQHLEPGGEAWLADPRRFEIAALPAAARAAGLGLHPSRTLPDRPQGARVELWRLTRGAGSTS
jgi:predicted nicotinamide N-methyase